MSCMRTVFVCGRTRCTPFIDSSSTALCAARLTATWKSRSMASTSSTASGGGSIASTAARIAAMSSSVRTREAIRTQPSSIHARAASTSASVVEPVWNQSATVSPIVAARTSGSGWRTNVPPVAPRVGCTSWAPARSFIVSRIVPRLTLYSSASSTSGGRRSPGASSPLRMLPRIWSAICCAALAVRIGRASKPAPGTGSTGPSYAGPAHVHAGSSTGCRGGFDRMRECLTFL